MSRLFTSCIAGCIALTSLAFAQSSATSSAPPTIHTVDVGKGNFMYEPNQTYAKPGDIVTFNFFPTNHSVVRSAYGLPCIPYEDTGNNLTGFASPNFLTQTLTDPPQWNLTINDTEPVFYYCTAIDSCIKQGMVGVINPNASVSLEKQYQQALQQPYLLTPGEPFPDEGEGGSSPTPAFSANPALLTAQPTGDSASTASSTATAQSSGGSKLSGGVIAGIVVAAVAFIALLAGFFWLLGHRRGFGSGTAAGQSVWGGKSSNQDRTEAWAAGSSTMGASELGRQSEMYQKGHWDPTSNNAYFGQAPRGDGTSSPAPSPGYMQPMMSPGMPSPGMPSPAAGGFQHGQHYPPPPMELGSTEVTELEAPHMIKK